MAKPALDVGIVTASAEPILTFYREVFGLEPLDGLQIPGIGRIHKLACGQSVLRVMVPEQAPEADEPPGGWAGRAGLRYLTLEVTDIRAAVEAAAAAGGTVALEPFELRPGRMVAQVQDPDGNMIEVGQGDG